MEICEELRIQVHYSSIYCPQGNDQVEITNKAIVRGLEKKIEKARKERVDLLPEILREYRTTTKNSTGETPFSLTYVMKEVVPVEMNYPTTNNYL